MPNAAKANDIELQEAYKELYKSYQEQKDKEIGFSLLKEEIKERKLKGIIDDSFFKKEKIVYRESFIKKYKPKPEAKEFLMDRGLLPLSVKLPKNITKFYNIDKAKLNTKDTLRIYSGGKKIFDPAPSIDSYTEDILNMTDKEIAEQFHLINTIRKKHESQLLSSKEKMIMVMKKQKINSLKTPKLGTLKLEEKFDIDPYIIYDTLTGKKELLVKNVDGKASILILPDNKKATLPFSFKLGEETIEDISKKDKLTSSTYIKKREYNKYVKEGYSVYPFEIKMDADEFFESLELSRSKISELVDNGIIKEKEFKELFEEEVQVDENGDPIFKTQILTEGAAEIQKDMFIQRLAEKAQKLAAKSNENYKPADSTEQTTASVLFEDIEF